MIPSPLYKDPIYYNGVVDPMVIRYNCEPVCEHI